MRKHKRGSNRKRTSFKRDDRGRREREREKDKDDTSESDDSKFVDEICF